MGTNFNRITATLINRINLNDSFVQLQFVSTACLKFDPGQFVNIKIGDQYRAYSIANLQTKGTFIDLAIDTTPGGIGSQFALNFKLGEEVEMLFGLGHFVLDSKPHSSIFVATGAGIAPYRAMIPEFFRRFKDGEATLVWGMKYQKDLFWQKLWQNIADHFPQFKYINYLSREKSVNQENHHIGRVDIFFDKKINTENNHVYICGNKQMIKNITHKCQNLGFDKQNIHFERYN